MKNLSVILALVANLESTCSKNGTFSKNFATSKSFFANIYQSQSKSYQVLKIEGPLRTIDYEINERGDSK
jgi:hypothetical protein